jgi:hypothetical protein
MDYYLASYLSNKYVRHETSIINCAVRSHAARIGHAAPLQNLNEKEEAFVGILLLSWDE